MRQYKPLCGIQLCFLFGITAILTGCSAAKEPEIAAQPVAAPVRKQIKTFSDFESSGLYRELNLTNIKNLGNYRLYQDQNNNYGMALQVDKAGNVTAERILPLPKVGSKPQNAGQVFFVMDLIFGDGAALNDIQATNQIKPILGQMLTAQGADFQNYHIALAQDPWKIRAGIEVKTKDAPAWNLTAPAFRDTSADRLTQLFAVNAIPIATAATTVTADAPRSTTTIAGESWPIGGAQKVNVNSKVEKVATPLKQVASLKPQLPQVDQQQSDNVANQAESLMKQQQKDRELERSKSERDSTLARSNDSQKQKFGIEGSVSFGKTKDSRSEKNWGKEEQLESPKFNTDEGDQLFASVPNFHPAYYRQKIERQVKDYLFYNSNDPFNQVHDINAIVSFSIRADGTPDQIRITSLNGHPEQITFEEMLQPLADSRNNSPEKRTINAIRGAGPFSVVPTQSQSVPVEMAISSSNVKARFHPN